jgi:hypothetical protein
MSIGSQVLGSQSVGRLCRLEGTGVVSLKRNCRKGFLSCTPTLREGLRPTENPQGSNWRATVVKWRTRKGEPKGFGQRIYFLVKL